MNTTKRKSLPAHALDISRRNLSRNSLTGSDQHKHVHTHDHSHHHGHGHNHNHGGHHGPKSHTNPEDRPESNDPTLGPSRRYRKSPYPMLSVEDALDLIAQHTPKPVVHNCGIDPGLVGCVLANDIVAPEFVPAFRASIVDGYAIKIPASGVFEKGVYPVSLISHASAIDLPPLKDGEIARITTGAPLPPDASAVVMVEDTVLVSKTADGTEEATVEILTSAIKDGENVREVGSDVDCGDVILRKGDVVSAIGGEYGLLASAGVRNIAVYNKPVVGVLSTGDELVEFITAKKLRLGEVRDTNRPTLLTAVKGAGFKAVDLGIAEDT